MKTSKVFKTKNDSILIVTAETDGSSTGKYVSVTANEITPITKNAAIEQVREGLEDGEMWRMAVEAGNTELGLSDWVEYVIDTDGELCGFDNSLYTNELTIDSEDYIFSSDSCGCLHDEINAVTKEFKRLIKLHLKDSEDAVKEAENIIRSIKSDDIDHEVERYTRQILGILS